MSLPLWDPIDLPPDWTLIDINSIDDEDLRLKLQGEIMQAWLDDDGDIPREWSANEGIFAVYDSANELLGVALMLEVL